MRWGQNDSAPNANSTTTKETSNGAPMGVSNWVAKGSGRGASPVAMTPNAHFGNTSPGSRANVDVNMYGNTTVGAFINNMAIGVFGVNATSMTNGGDGLILPTVSNPGSGYSANATVTLTLTNGGSSGVVNAQSNSVGKISNLNISTAGSGYMTAPTLTIAAPASISIGANTTNVEPTGANSTFNANTLGITANQYIAISTANTVFPTVGQKVLYRVPASNTAVAPLVGNTYYWIAFSNTTVVTLAQSYAAAIANTPVNTLNPGSAAMTGALANTYDVILTASAQYFQAGDKLTYGVPTGNTAIPPLTGNSTYYVTFANSSALALSATAGGANISFSPSFTSAEVHTLTGTTATGYVDVASVYPEVTHAGWVVRREGTGGRAGRVHFETLVAMHSIGVNGTTSTGVYGTANVISSNAAIDAIVP